MKRTVFALVALAAAACIVGYIGPAYGRATRGSAPTFVKRDPPGYGDWRVISVAHEEGNIHSLGAVLGNDLAIKAYREGRLPFRDGTIIAALHYSHASSEENNKVFGRSQSFVAGAPTNIQFMVKDSKKYATTGGWGFGHFKDCKPAGKALMKTCFPATIRSKLAILFSPAIYVDIENHSRSEFSV